MFKVIKGPKFDESLNPGNPELSLPSEVVEKSAQELSLQIDTFVRKAIKKVLPDNTLGLFVESKSAVPQLDLVMELVNVYQRKITVLFRGKELGSAAFVTSYIQTSEGGWNIIHEMSEINI